MKPEDLDLTDISAAPPKEKPQTPEVQPDQGQALVSRETQQAPPKKREIVLRLPSGFKTLSEMTGKEYADWFRFAKLVKFLNPVLVDRTMIPKDLEPEKLSRPDDRSKHLNWFTDDISTSLFRYYARHYGRLPLMN